ncbi:hypothetical protein LO771_10190 [Streptacidiphilus sp. ASG 303]|uniref:hypothetical protein n=1 Tax=Streptacidiphilus sp. ASG 303 TaxID=2896847 RepID=UPI001E3AD2EE|nr:hypothetical protein [Streptacidiphilus sp. ASG 303]MCD0482757.1 hypothetical protein [Streptacidiphilus sp. ASG 303]
MTTTRLQQAAYNAQWAAGLPTSDLARELFTHRSRLVSHRRCAIYIHSLQEAEWFLAAFASHARPITVVGGRGVSHADAALRRVKIGANDRLDAARCEHACLHELAHIVTPDVGPGGGLREPARGRGSSRGHHHAWRVNFVLITRKALGKEAAVRLRHEFDHWGLPTRK